MITMIHFLEILLDLKIIDIYKHYGVIILMVQLIVGVSL